MGSTLVIVGLTTAFIGSVVLIWNEVKTGAAAIRWWRHYNPDKQLPGGIYRRTVFLVAERLGPKDPWAMQEFAAESFPANVAGLGLLLLGFLLQAFGAIAAYPGTEL
jgi:hypothetical protein